MFRIHASPIIVAIVGIKKVHGQHHITTIGRFTQYVMLNIANAQFAPGLNCLIRYKAHHITNTPTIDIRFFRMIEKRWFVIETNPRQRRVSHVRTRIAQQFRARFHRQDVVPYNQWQSGGNIFHG